MLVLETQFLGNRETRILYLDAQFWKFVQGDLSIADYCKEFQKMAARLRDLGEVVPDRTLVLNVLRGLNERYSAIALHLRRARPFPTYDEAVADLLMEELHSANRSSSSTALIATTGGSSAPCTPPLLQLRGRLCGWGLSQAEEPPREARRPQAGVAGPL